MNKLLTRLLVFTIIIQLLAVSAWTQEANAAAGTLLDPHIIMNASDLSNIRNNRAEHYRLGANIDLSGYDHDGAGPDTGGWLPIDSVSGPFTGSLDGNGYTISNMRIDRPTLVNGGLFGRMGGAAKLSDIRLRDIQIVGNSLTGGLVGNQQNGTIERSYVTGTIRVTGQAPVPNNAAVNAGGLVGVVASGTIENSYAVVDVSGWNRIGGLVGTNAGTIRNAYAAGWVNGDNEIGGLVGFNMSLIENSYAAGNVGGNTPVGGLAGRNEFDGSTTFGTATNSYWNVDTTGQTGIGVGTGITSEAMKDPDTFSLDPSVWGIIEGVTYPYLRAFGMGIGVDPLAVTTYSLQPGQDAVSVTGSVYHESAMEPIDVQYIIRDSNSGTTITNNTYPTIDSDALRPINRRFSLSGYANGNYTLTVTGTDSYGTAVGTTLAFTVNTSAAAPPTVQFTNNDEAWAQSAATTVTIGNGDGVIDDSTLHFSWSTDTATPGPGSTWTLFESGDTLSRSGVNGDVYLHIRVKDLAGVTANVVSNRFRVDIVAPTINFSTNGSEIMAQSASTTVTVTDAGGGVDASSLQYAWTEDTATPTSWTPFTSGGTLTISAVNGDRYLHIKASDAAGNIANGVSNRFRLRATPSNIMNQTVPSSVIEVPKAVIDVNGRALDPDSIDITKSSVTLDVTPKAGLAYVSIPANILLNFAEHNSSFFIEIKTPYGRYHVPVNLAALIPELNDLLAASNLKAKDISFKIILNDKSDDKDIKKAFKVSLIKGNVMGAIVDFHMEVINTKSGQIIGTVDQFNKTLTRVIPMPKSITSMPEQWGAFRYNASMKKFEFVPAQGVQIDGVWYVIIRSYSNSVYAVAHNPVSFTDTLKHWGKSYVELSAAKGLIEGVGSDKFQPNRSITRAEFTAMLIRALGYSESKVTSSPYNDIKLGSWYYNMVSKAKQLGLLDFAKGNSFKPDQLLTREEMASLLAAVIALEKLPMTKEFVSLDGYTDVDNVDAAYLEDVRTMVKLNIMTGTGSNAFSPKGESTRAQAGVVLVRTLKALEMID